MEGHILQICQDRPSSFGGQLWLAVRSALLMWLTLSCVLVHAHVWHRIVPGCATAQANMYFIGRKMVIFLSYICLGEEP